MSIKLHIQQRYPNERTDVIARDLNISVAKVYRIANTLGVKKSKEYMLKYKPGAENLIKYGAQHRFKKGITAHNKGVKMSDDKYEKCKGTMFKAGNKPHNIRPDGSIRISQKGNELPYQYIKIADQDWRLLHRHNWEQVNGPIPKGMVLRFRDGDTMNCDINNLELISHGENLSRNTLHNYPAEIKEVVKLRNKLNKKINGKEQNQ